jgi:hypothetical protein
MALGEVGRPALPVLVQAGQRVDRRGARAQSVVSAGQQLRPPGRDTGPRVQQRHVVLAPVER